MHKLILRYASPVFRDMLDIPHPVTSDSNAIVVDLSDDASVLEILPRMINVMVLPELKDLDTIEEIACAADKYDMSGPLSILRQYICTYLYDFNPFHVYAIARRYGWNDEAKAASTRTLRHDIVSDYSWEFVQGLDQASLYSLMSLHAKLKDTFRSIIESGGDWIGGAEPKYVCTDCGQEHKHNAIADVFERLRPATVRPRLWDMENVAMLESLLQWPAIYDTQPILGWIGLYSACPDKVCKLELDCEYFVENLRSYITQDLVDTVEDMPVR
jgi:hypothetical protein